MIGTIHAILKGKKKNDSFGTSFCRNVNMKRIRYKFLPQDLIAENVLIFRPKCGDGIRTTVRFVVAIYKQFRDNFKK